MNTGASFISSACRKRLHAQGYDNFSDKELSDFKYGIRFAYAGCITLVAFGIYFQSIPVLAVAATIALVAAFPPYHPLDYLYNYGVRLLLNKPKLPPRTAQGRFACGVATVWLAVTIYLLYNNYTMAGNILAIALFAVGLLVTTTDICIPSMFYNGLFKRTKTINP
ncbi:MAG: DUF4395 family protein [Bacteroidota bacterium]